MTTRRAASLTVMLALFIATNRPSYGQADTETILHTFVDGEDGALPAGIVSDRQGNLYGTVGLGGTGPCTDPLMGCGLVLEGALAEDASGQISWQGRVVYDFQGGEADGANPNAPLALGPDGSLYGTTVYGGGSGCNGPGCGTVFELERHGDQWVESVPHKFSGPDGGNPESAVTLDSTGDIFGTTYNGGIHACAGSLEEPCGVVYELQHTGSSWMETVLHAFDNEDGAQPFGGVVIDKSGNLYGTTPYGGRAHLDPYAPAGTIYELSPTQTGWSFQVLYRFANGQGGSEAGLTLDAEGNLYGTTYWGGIYGYGSVFELQRPTEEGAPWNLVLLHSFSLFGDGGFPTAGVVFDKAGNLYGTAANGGTSSTDCSCGVVYEMTPSQGSWTFNTLYSFQGDTTGATPTTAPLVDPSGNVFGTAAYGGDPNCVATPYSGCGVIYRIQPRRARRRALGSRPEVTPISFTGIQAACPSYESPVIPRLSPLHTSALCASVVVVRLR